MKRLITLFSLVILSQVMFGQLSGTKTIPGDYATIAAAVTDLNNVGVLSGGGGVTFNVAPGYTETITAPISVTATGTLADQIIFQKASSGTNPLITAYVGTSTPGSAGQDGIWNLVGSDYVTIDGIDLYDPNSTNPATMEYGYAMFKASVTNGCQYNTIKNCVVTLSRNNNASGTSPAVDGSRAINVMNSLVTTQTTVMTPTLASGTNSYNKFYSNTLQNCNIGVALIGYAGASPFTLCDYGNDIGGSSLSTGNNIINYGGAASASNPAAGVRTLAQYDLNVSYNTVNNNNGSGVNHVSTLRGIYLNTALSASATISYNTLSISSGATTSQVSVIENVAGGTAAGNTININYNTITNCNWTTATSGIFYGIYSTSSSSPANLNINNNSFANITRPGTGAANLIYNASGVGTALSISNNTYTNLSLATTGTVYFIYNNNATNNMTISGNAISGTFSKTGAGGSVIGYYDFGSPTGGSATISGNNFSNITITGATTFYGLQHYTSTTQVNTIYNNTISNVTGGTSPLYGIYQGYGAAGSSVYGNNVYNISASGTGAIYGITVGQSTAPTSLNVYNNNVYGLSITGTGAIYGIHNNLGTLNHIYKNNIYNLSSNNASGLIYGLYVSSGTTTYLYNNFISDLRATAATGTNAISGIYIAGGTTVGAYYNSIYLYATSSSATTFGTSGIYTSTTPTVDLRNNVIVNVSTPGPTGGVTVAYRRSSTTLTSYSSNSNNNDYYAGATEDATHAIYFDGTTAYAIAPFKTLVSPRDAASFRESPPFINVASAPYNLHMNTGTPTQCESGGISISSPIAITADYDGDTRNASTPDVGADEFIGTGLDLAAPGITFTQLGNTAGTGDRTLSTTITDASGVPTSGPGLPVLYWKINANPYNAAPATYISGNQYDFTFGSGVNPGDVVSYYIVAQDIVTPVPNIGAKPSAGASGFTYDPPACGTPPTTPYTYTIVSALSGTFTVGSGGNYPTLTGAGGLFADINAKVITGNITAQIISDLTEDGLNALNQMAEEPNGSNFTLTVQPDAATLRTISGTYAGGLIRLNGADRVNFDGRYSGSGNYLKFSHIGTAGAVFQLISLGNGAGASNNTIRNCYINMGGNASGTYGVVIGGSTVASTGADNDNNSLMNNIISKAYLGIWAQGTAATNPGAMDNLQLVGNSLGSNLSSDYLGHDGIFVGYGLNGTISENTVYNIITPNSTPVGITLTTGFTNATISRNNINNVKYTGSSGYGGRGMYINSATTPTNLNINNNLIYAIGGDGYTGFSASSPVGLYFDGTLSGLNIYFNSVYMSGVVTYNGATLTTAILFNAATITIIDLRDNIFMNTMDNVPLTTDKNYAIYSTAPASSFTNINYNDYYFAGAQGVLGYLGGDQATLAAWKIATGKDANSINSDPVFSSSSDLRIGLGSPVIAAGTPISGVDFDYANTDRSDSNPTIGAYENGGDFAGPLISYTALGNISSTTNRAFDNVAITDYSGVNTTPGTNPRVYYKRSTDANAFNDNSPGTDGWKYAETSSGSSPFNFTIDYGLLNGGTGVSVGTTVQYFVVAQDIQGTPYVGINSGTFAATPASVALTSGAFPIGGTINSYMIAAAFNGTILVGIGQTYTSLTADASTGLFKAINTGVLTDNVIVNIISDLTETGAIALNQFSEEGAGNYTMTIVPDGSTIRTASGSYSGGLIRLNGADRVIFDGRFSGSGNYLAFTNSGTSGAVFQLISLGANAGATNNTIRNCNINTGSNASGTYGIVIGGSSVASTGADNDNNTIQANNISKAYVGVWAQGTVVTNPGIMDNLQILGNSIGSGTVASYIGLNGIIVGYGTGCLISQNTIYNIITTATIPVGITASTGFISSTISRNNINNITYTGTSGWGGRGMYINTANATSNLSINNNLIYVIGGDGWTGFSNSSMVGMYFDGTMAGLNIYFNSVNMSGTFNKSSATLTTAILFYTSTITGIDLRDNIFKNSMDNTGMTTDKNYAIYSAAPNTSFTNINYNDYYVSGAQGILGYLGADQATLAAWKTATGQDVNSVNVDPIFASNSDLRIDLSSPIIGVGTPISGIDYDYTNTNRSDTAPSLGAYETGGDYSGPIITYTALGNTTNTSNRALTNVAITDGSGVNTDPGTKPRVYFKRSTDGNVWYDNTPGTDGWKYAEANGASSPFDFTIDYNLLNGGTGVIPGNVVQYFVVAQDQQVTPLVSINSGTFTTQPASVNLTSLAFPIGGTINSYIIATLLSGTKTVGTAGDYVNLTGPSGLFKAINENVVNGDLTILINSNLTEEGTNALRLWAEEGAGGYSITIKPNSGITATITGAYSSGALIRLVGVSKVTIDGSNNGSTTRDLTFSNTSATSPSVLLIGSVATTPISNNTVKNCILINGSTLTSALLVSDATTPGNDGYFSNITIQNNSIQLAYIGAYVRSAVGQGSNVTVSNNSLNTSGTNNIRYMGLYFQGINSAAVFGNKIGNFEKVSGENDKGIFIATSCSNFNVYDNSIDNIGYSGTSGYGAQGIYVSTGLPNANINIYNNLISNITGDGDDYTNATYDGLQYNPMGIFLLGDQTGISVYYNSIYLSGNTLNFDANSMSIGICLLTNCTADIRNNLIENNLGLLGSVGYGACGIYAQGSASQFTNINNNDYYINPSGSAAKALGKISTTTTATALGAWQTATGQDAKSISADPLYVSTTDLQLQLASPAKGKAEVLTSVTTDYTGAFRHIFKPTMGAYDYAPTDFRMWTGLVDSDWNTPGNWTPTSVPGATDDAGVPTDPASDPNVFPIVPAGTFSVDELFVGSGASVTVPNGATLNVTNTNP